MPDSTMCFYDVLENDRINNMIVLRKTTVPPRGKPVLNSSYVSRAKTKPDTIFIIIGVSEEQTEMKFFVVKIISALLF